MSNKDRVKELLSISKKNGMTPNRFGHIKWTNGDNAYRFVFKKNVMRYETLAGKNNWVRLRSYKIKDIDVSKWEEMMKKLSCQRCQHA